MIFFKFSLRVICTRTIFRWNPFARKSRGILGVIHAQKKKNRIVSKHGRLNTVRPSGEVEENHRFEFSEHNEIRGQRLRFWLSLIIEQKECDGQMDTFP